MGKDDPKIGQYMAQKKEEIRFIVSYQKLLLSLILSQLYNFDKLVAFLIPCENNFQLPKIVSTNAILY